MFPVNERGKLLPDKSRADPQQEVGHEDGSLLTRMGNRADYCDPKLLRKALGAFATGVTVVTTIDAEGHPRGLTANSFTSVSLDPPLVLICIGNHAASFETFASTKRFAISILAEDQQGISALFSSKTYNKFDQVSWRVEETGAPVLDGALAWLDCTVHESVHAGDHLVLIGRILRFDSAGGRPLGFFAGQYVKFGYELDLLDHSTALTEFGCLVEVSDRLLLCRAQVDGGWSIPTIKGADSARLGREAVRALCSTLGVEVSLSFIYSVFTAENGSLSIVYMGSSRSEALAKQKLPPSATLFDADEVPWDSITSQAHRAMLRRYIDERIAGRFGIYVESDNGGQVALLDGNPQPFDRYAARPQR